MKTLWLRFSSYLRRQFPVREAVGAKESNSSSTHLVTGQRGELLAAEHLKCLGYQLVASNFQLPIGRSRRGRLINAEIDIIAYEGATLCFIEVKTRISDWFAAPEANVDLSKQRQISRAARVYRRMFGLVAAPYRYDVVSVLLPAAQTDGGAPLAPHLDLLKNFWTDEKFRRKRLWIDTDSDF